MSRLKTKRYLLLLSAVGLLAIGGGAGTFATFNAETTNTGNTFATGTLLLSNLSSTANACFSAGDANHTNASGNVAGGCDAVLAGTSLFPGHAAITGTVTIQNVGSLAASVLKLSTSGCTPVVVTSTNGFNTGNLCDSVEMYVQELSGSISGTPTHCFFGKADVTNTTCVADFAGATPSATSITKFATDFGSSGVSLGSSPLAGPLPPDGARYFKVGLYLPGAASGDNVFQGLSATFPLTWHIDA